MTGKDSNTYKDPKTADPSIDDLTRQVHALQAEVKLLNSHRFVRIHNSMPRLLAFNFARGLAVGLGTVLGASVLLSLIIWSLSQIEFLPIIGEWAAEIADQMSSASQPNR